jgi:type I restriction enzyme S subunit
VTDTQSMIRLPKGWAWAKLGEVCKDPQYGWTTSAIAEGELHLLRTTDITSGNVDWRSVPYCKEEPIDAEKYLLEDGDVVISRAGSVGFSHLIRNPKPSIFASYLIRFKPLIDERYLAYFLKSPPYWQAISERKIGIALANVNASKLRQIPMPIAPLGEQIRIVGRIEELFARLDAGVEGLRKVKAQLNRYRQAALKYAFEGRLTEEWRKTHKDQIEPAKKDLEVYPSDVENSPEAWTRVRLETISNLITKGESPHWQGFDYVEQGVTFIRSENVLWGKVNLSNAARIPEEFHEKLKRSQVKGGDVLVNLVGASIGRCGVVPSSIEKANVNQAVAIVRLNEPLLPSYLMYLILSPQMQETLQNSKVETARPNISLQDLRQLRVSLPSSSEQIRIVDEIERRFSIAEKTKESVKNSLEQADRLRQSVLRCAFEGKLVPQDPNDESAEKLLERIREERAKSKGEKNTNKRMKNKPRQLELSTYVK